MTKLKKRTLEIYAFIIQYKRQHDGCAPSIRDIMRGCDVSSTSVVNYHLEKLELADMISRGRFPRFIHVSGGRWTFEPTA